MEWERVIRHHLSLTLAPVSNLLFDPAPGENHIIVPEVVVVQKMQGILVFFGESNGPQYRLRAHSRSQIGAGFVDTHTDNIMRADKAFTKWQAPFPLPKRQNG